MPANASSNWTAEHPRARPTRWTSAHLYYHDALDNLLRSAVLPLVGELNASGLIEGFFFVRYWQGGPHLRLRLLRHDDVGEGPVQRVVEEHLGRFFTRHPSRTLVRPEDYLRSAGELAHHEFGPRGAEIEPLRPNNSLRYAPYLPEEDRLGGPAGVAAFEPHFLDSAALALQVINTHPAEGQRSGRAWAMMLLAGTVLLPDPHRLARFFRFSARDWGTRSLAGDHDRYARTQAHFEQRYQRQRVPLEGLARRLLSEARPAADENLDAISARWVRSCAALGTRLSTAPLRVESALFQCLHKHNNRLGISMAEETYLLFLLGRGLGEITGGKDRDEP